MYDTAHTPETTDRPTPRQIALVQKSWRQVLPIQELAAELFYRRLFELDPYLVRLFRGDMRRQGRMLMSMLTTVVTRLHCLAEISPAVEELGRAHVGYGVQPEDYDTVGRALLDTLRAGLGETFDAETEQAWGATYRTLGRIMRRAYEPSA